MKLKHMISILMVMLMTLNFMLCVGAAEIEEGFIDVIVHEEEKNMAINGLYAL